VGAVGVICWPLLRMVCCARSAGMRVQAKNPTAAISPIVLLKNMPETSNWEMKTNKKVYLFKRFTGMN